MLTSDGPMPDITLEESIKDTVSALQRALRSEAEASALRAQLAETCAAKNSVIDGYVRQVEAQQRILDEERAKLAEYREAVREWAEARSEEDRAHGWSGKPLHERNEWRVSATKRRVDAALRLRALAERDKETQT